MERTSQQGKEGDLRIFRSDPVPPYGFFLCCSLPRTACHVLAHRLDHRLGERHLFVGIYVPAIMQVCLDSFFLFDWVDWWVIELDACYIEGG